MMINKYITMLGLHRFKIHGHATFRFPKSFAIYSNFVKLKRLTKSQKLDSKSSLTSVG